MAIFVLAGLFANLISNIGFTTSAGKWVSIKGYLYADILSPIFGATLGSLIFALMFIGFCWLVALPLYKKKIYIKI
jgi:predicted acyltransferase